MAHLASVRATLSTTDPTYEIERDDVQAQVAATIGSLGVGDPIPVGIEVASPWHFDGIDKDVKPHETYNSARRLRGASARLARQLRRASARGASGSQRYVMDPSAAKTPYKPTPTLISRALHPFRSLFGYDPTMPTKGVVMRPDSVGSQFATQSDNYRNAVRFGTGSFLGGDFAGEERGGAYRDDEGEWQAGPGREGTQGQVDRPLQIGDYTDYVATQKDIDHRRARQAADRARMARWAPDMERNTPHTWNDQLAPSEGRMMYAPVSSAVAVDEGPDGMGDSPFTPLSTI